MNDPESERPQEDWPPQENPPTLDYRAPRLDKPKRLSGGQLFVQATGGIILGIGVFAFLAAATESIAAALSIPIAIGIGLCFIPRVRGLGIGFIIALPVGALIGIGICYITGDKI